MITTDTRIDDEWEDIDDNEWETDDETCDVCDCHLSACDCRDADLVIIELLRGLADQLSHERPAGATLAGGLAIQETHGDVPRVVKSAMRCGFNKPSWADACSVAIVGGDRC